MGPSIYWYYSDGEGQVGPVDDAEFRRLLGKNVIRPETLIWREGMPKWQPRRVVISVTAPAGSILCAACGCLVPAADGFSLSGQTYCATCKPQILQRIQEGKGLPANNAEALRRAYIGREASVRSVGLLYYLGGASLGFVGIVLLMRYLGGNGREPISDMVTGVSFVILSVLQFVGGSALRHLRPWSRILVGIVSGFGALGFPIGTLINAYILYLVFSPKGAMLFTLEYQVAIAQTPHIRYRTSVGVWIALGIILLLIVAAVVAGNIWRS